MIREFHDWLISEGKSVATATVYAYAVQRGVRAFGDSPSPIDLDAYAAGLPVQARGVFRSAWRRFVEFSASRGRPVAAGSRGHLKPAHRRSLVPVEDFAIEYLARAIPISSFGDLRWSDVEFLSGADARVSDPSARRVYVVHRRALDVLRAWGYPRGGPFGAIVPDEPQGRSWMPPEELTERVERARGADDPMHPEARFLRALPAPRSEPMTLRG